jgi:hypothetical protein
MMKSFLLFACMAWSLLPMPASVTAQTGRTSAFDDAQVVVEFNLEQFRSTELGGKIMAFAKDQAIRAIEEQGAGEAPSLEDVNNFLGFNPFEEIRGAVIAIDDMENPEENLVAIVQLGETTGNIEGLVLGLPGYESTKEGGITVHSADVDGQKIFGAINALGKNKAIVVAPSKDRLKSAMGQVGDVRKLAGTSSQAPFVRVTVNKLPADLIGDGPQSNVAKLLKSIELTVAENGDELAAILSIGTDNTEQAEQIRQMADGLKAMLGFAMSQAEEDEDLKRVIELAKGLKVSSDENRVNASLSIPVELVLEFLRKEADLPF